MLTIKKFKNWFQERPKKQKVTLFIILFLFVYVFLKPNPNKEIPEDILSNNEWFVEKGNINSLYKSDIWLSFKNDDGGMYSSEGLSIYNVEVWEGGTGTKSCLCSGRYTLNKNKKVLEMYGIRNINCPWMSKLNGRYKYIYKDTRDGFNKYMFKKGNITITHLFNENRD